MITEQPRHPVPDHIPAHLRQDFAATAGRAPSPNSPYQPGEAVQRHGFSGNLPGHGQTGFRGWVVGSIGGTILTGITADGEPWAEHWGDLRHDGLPVDPWSWCTCCREARRPLLRAYYDEQRAAGQQLDLFDGSGR